MTNRKKCIVFVEPAAYLEHGHFLEKLELWCRGFAELGFSPVVYSWLLPKSAAPQATYRAVPSVFNLLGKIVPEKRLAIWVEFWTYLFAFKYARRHNLPVLGLTASGPISIATAAHFFTPPQAWGQIVMYAGLVNAPNGYRVRPNVLGHFKTMLNRKCSLLCNSKLGSDSLRSALMGKEAAERVHFLPDPINVPDATLTVDPAKWNSPVHLFVPGGDDHRRNPLQHLQKAELEPRVSKVSILQPGKHALLLADGVAWTKPSFIEEVQVISSYIPGEALPGAFSSAKFSLIAYAPDFLQGSANLALSIACGTPVLCSHFPYADHLFECYGKIGEQFECNDLHDFQRAWNRLANWKKEDWATFESARTRLATEVRYESISKKASGVLCLG